MTKTERRAEFIKRVAVFVSRCDANGMKLAPFWFYRTVAEQKALYDKGLSNCDGTVKVSAHQKWLAMDFALLNADGTDFIWDAGAYGTFGQIAQDAGLTWGGSWHTTFNDVYHVELPAEAD